MMNSTRGQISRSAMVLSALVLVLVLGGIVLLLSNERGGRGASEKRTVSLRLKWTYSVGFAGAIMGKETGAFKGLDLRIEPGGPSLDPITLVANGTDDFGIAGADRLLQARAQGLPLVAVALENRNSFACLLALADANITSPHDLRGRRVGTLRDDTYTVYRALVAKLKLPTDSIQEVPVGFDLTPLLQRTVDAYPCYTINQPPRLKQQNIAHVVLRPQKYGIDFAGNVYFTREELIKNQPATVQAFVDGLVAGWEATLANPQNALDVALRSEPSLDRAGEQALLQALLPELTTGGRRLLWIEPDDLAETERILREQGLLSAPVDVNEAVDPRFIRQAHENR